MGYYGGAGYLWNGFNQGMRLGMDIQDRSRNQERQDELWLRQDTEWDQGQTDRERRLNENEEDRAISKEDRIRRHRREDESDSRAMASHRSTMANQRLSREASLYQLTKQKRLDFSRAFEGLFTNPNTGEPLTAEEITQDHADAATKLFQNYDFMGDFIRGGNPNVDGLERLVIIPDETDPYDMKKRRVTAQLRMKDGSIQPMTFGRSSDPDDPVSAPTIDEFGMIVNAEANPERALAARDARLAQNQFEQKERFKSKLKREENAADPTKEKPNQVRLNAENGGRLMTDAQMIADYKAEWGVVDPNDPFSVEWNPDRPSYVDWYNARVMPQYQRQAGTAGAGNASGNSSEHDTRMQAYEELHAENQQRPFFQRYLPGTGPTEEDVNQRVQQINQSRGASRQAAQPTGQTTTPGNAANSQTPQPAQSQTAPKKAPPEAIQYLMENAGENPALRNLFYDKYGYLPEGV